MEAFSRESRETSTSANSYILFLISTQKISTTNTFRSAVNDIDDVNDPSPTKKRKKNSMPPCCKLKWNIFQKWSNSWSKNQDH